MITVIPTDIYDKDGNMLRIEFHDESGKHQIDAAWDESDAQTSENREAFRNWAYKFIEKKDFKVRVV